MQVQDGADSEESDEISRLLVAHADAVGQPLIDSCATVSGPTGDAKDTERRR